MDCNNSKYGIEIINTILKKYKSDYDGNFYVGEFVEAPNTLGCFQRYKKWYLYEVDEKNSCTFTGPFSLNGIIYACALKLGISKELEEFRFENEEFSIFIHNHFRTFSEIDFYINRNLGE